MGDFNVDFLTLPNSLMTSFESYNCSQIINEPTRVTNSSSTLLDPILISNLELIKSAGTIPVHHISDYSLVFLEMKIYSPSTIKFSTFRSYKNFDHASFLSGLYTLPWDNILLEMDIDKKVACFNNFLIYLIYLINICL